MAKKTSGQNPVDEAYLRSLMAGVPSEPPYHLYLQPAEVMAKIEKPLYPMRKEKRMALQMKQSGMFPMQVVPTVRKWLRKKRHRKRFARLWLTLYADSSPLINVKADRGYI